jgi:alcohol dehydrogenase (cytochrome c)
MTITGKVVGAGGLRPSAAGIALAGVGTTLGYLALSLTSPAPARAQAPGQPGRTEYLTHCASCHGDQLTGAGFGPPLKGSMFKNRWSKEAPEALQAYIKTNMPPSAPSSLSEETYKQVSAYIREQNGMKAGASQEVNGPAGEVGSAPAEKVGLESGGNALAEVNTDATYESAIAARAAKLATIHAVDAGMLRDPDPGDWLNYRRSSDGTGFSPLTQLNPKTVAGLKLAWSLTLPAGTNAITPLVRDGVMFLNSSGTVMAIDGATGDVLWKFVRPAEALPMGPPVTQPRSIALYDNLLIVPTNDNHEVALNVRSGKVIWDHKFEGLGKGLRPTAGPLVVGDRVIQGLSGCAGVLDAGGCFVIGLDARSGAEVWRLRTIAQAGDADGKTWNGAPNAARYGASTWTPATFDPESGLVYIGTGQTYHIATLMLPHGERSRRNAGLYTDSTLAIDPVTGRLRWHFQHMARDVWDLDWSFERTIATISINGRVRRVVMTVGKIGILDLLDARTGEYLGSYDMGLQSLVTKIDPKTGWKYTDPRMEPDPAKSKLICPHAVGVRNWPATSYDASTSTLYVSVLKSCMQFSWMKGEGFDISYGMKVKSGTGGNVGGVMAIDVSSLKARWTKTFRAPTASAILATGGGLVFVGSRDRYFRALGATTGSVLWEVRLNNVPSSTPVTFLAGGTQHVALTTGGGNPNDISVKTLTPELDPVAPATTLWVFR